ncbi:hypothetical protein [Motiliproteus sp. SC1-56]|uniref:hypothetical protein n=1 Tax=Motiliproteus sp. SC1-56 TaxID=2799565 RepID=UPI001A8DDBEE|nr:hypothetical protein [Motiliproteus sp. SC1-56]
MKAPVSRAPLLPFAATTLLLLLNYPWLSLFDSKHLVADIPPLFLYLFVLWLVFILTVRFLLHPGPVDEGDSPVRPRTGTDKARGNRGA